MSKDTEVSVEIPSKLISVFTGSADVRGAYGGRGSAKTRSFAKMLAVMGYRYGKAGIRGQLLCARQYMNSLEESSLEECKRAIESEPFLLSYYNIGDKFIKSYDGNIDFSFAGLDRNIASIKSKGRILICWIDEAEVVSNKALTVLIPTLREENLDWNAELWVTWNPALLGSPVDKKFRNSTDDRYKVVEINWRDNPKFPAVLERQRIRDLKTRPDEYNHIWEGGYLINSEAQVFKNWSVEEFERPEGTIYRLGADWGFSVDPSVLIRCSLEGNIMYVDYEAYQVGCEIVNLPELFMQVPESEKWPITADSARPETISHMQKNGFPRMRSAIKGLKSLKEGVEFLKSYDIVVHPRCERTIYELTMYSYKVDKLTGDIAPILEDNDNHVIDALRYACEGARRALKSMPKKLKLPPIATNTTRWMS